eukprot:569164-Lingulodinium_polyedra.AAC.1
MPRPAPKAALASRREARLERIHDTMKMEQEPEPEDLLARAQSLTEEAEKGGDWLNTQFSTFKH